MAKGSNRYQPQHREGRRMADRGQSPTVHQRRLRAELRRMREASGQTQEQVAAALDWSLSKVIRIEGGAVGISITDLRALLQHYNVLGDRAEQLVEIARAARERTWWSGYRKVLTPGYAELIGYETAASALRQFELLIVPGLLQIEDYARSYISGLISPSHAGDVDALVDVRMRRQEILESDNPPHVHFIMDESAVRRQVGGRGVMRRQLHHLIEMASRPHVVIEVVPFSVGVHFGIMGSFTLIEFPEAEDEDVLRLETPRTSTIQRGVTEDVVYYREAFEELRSVSLRPEGSAALLSRLAESL
jgi:transcriptional regulator with XRE-family HTH domain